MTELIALIENVRIGGSMGDMIFPILCAFLFAMGILVCFYSHKIRNSLNVVIGALAGAMVGSLVSGIVFVDDKPPLFMGLITLAFAVLLSYVSWRTPMIAAAVMMFAPVTLALGYLLSTTIHSLGVCVFLSIVFGSLFTLVGAKIGRYFVICVSALTASLVSVLSFYAALGILSKAYNAHGTLIVLPILILASAGAAYQIITNPERLQEIEDKKKAEHEKMLEEFAVKPMWGCKSCHTNNRITVLYCQECGKTRLPPEKPNFALPKSANPGWRCVCGKINSLSAGKCSCGVTIGNAEEWACSCGTRNGSTTDLCNSCGQGRYQPYAKPYAAAAPVKENQPAGAEAH